MLNFKFAKIHFFSEKVLLFVATFLHLIVNGLPLRNGGKMNFNSFSFIIFDGDADSHKWRQNLNFLIKNV